MPRIKKNNPEEKAFQTTEMLGKRQSIVRNTLFALLTMLPLCAFAGVVITGEDLLFSYRKRAPNDYQAFKAANPPKILFSCFNLAAGEYEIRYILNVYGNDNFNFMLKNAMLSCGKNLQFILIAQEKN